LVRAHPILPEQEARRLAPLRTPRSAGHFFALFRIENVHYLSPWPDLNRPPSRRASVVGLNPATSARVLDGRLGGRSW